MSSQKSEILFGTAAAAIHHVDVRNPSSNAFAPML